MPEYKYDRQDRIRAMRLYEKGLSCREVGEITGILPESIRGWARQKGVIRRKGGGSTLTKQQKEEVRRLYVRCRQSRRQIATQTGLSQWVIYNYLKSEGLMRSRSKAVSIAMTGSKRGSYNKNKEKNAEN